jgi:hypothetical protein
MSNGRLELPVGWQRVHLREIAQIASGVTKGRKFNGAETVSSPYLRVANVQAGRLDLTEVKEVEVLPSDVEKYRLQPGDVLMTEGGDRDKLGRGSIWRGEVANCIHQNHIFRVRPNLSRLLPEYLSLYLGSPDAKSYFLRAAKQTTGIASINITQLSEFPVVVPPVKEQRRIAAALDKADAIRQKLEEGIRLTEELLRSSFLEMFGEPATNPKDWQVLPLTEIVAEMEGGKSLLADTVESESTVYRVLKVSAVTWADYRPEESKPVPENYVPPLNHIVQPGAKPHRPAGRPSL